MSNLKQVRLTKYGFSRWPEEDFSDDGNRFTCYRYYGCRVSYLHADGMWYIAARINDYELSFTERKDLPYYRDLDMLNGVETVSEEDIEKLKAAIIGYVNAYKNKVEELNKNNPTMEEMLALRENHRNYYRDLKKQIDKRFTPEILKLSAYELGNFKNYYNSLVSQCNCYTDEYLEAIFNKGQSRQFMNNKTSDFYYQELNDYMKKVGI